MRVLFNLFLDICLFRKGPQNVPASTALLKMCLLAYAVSSLLVSILHVPLQVALLQILIDLVLLAGLLYLALILHQHSARFEQTLTAITGSGTLISLLALPLTAWIVHQGPQGDSQFPSLLMQILIIWNIAVMTHILRQAFNTSAWVGALYALGYTFLSLTLIGWIG